MVIVSNSGLSDGFWGALIGALITGAAGIIIISIQLWQQKSDLKHESKKEIRHVVYFSGKYLNILKKIISIRLDIEQYENEIRGYKIVGINQYGAQMKEGITPNEEISPEVQKELVRNMKNLTLPKTIKQCNQVISKIKNVNLNSIRYKQFENVLKIIDKIESITSKDYETNSIEVLNRKQLEIDNLYKQLKGKLD